MTSNRQKLDDWVRRERRRQLRDLILASTPFVIALAVAAMVWIDPEAGSMLARLLKLSETLLAWIFSVTLVIAAWIYGHRILRRRWSRHRRQDQP